MSYVRVEALSKSFGSTKAIERLDMELDNGECARTSPIRSKARGLKDKIGEGWVEDTARLVDCEPAAAQPAAA